jgi:uncharacterized membrane protein YidH (DUF202 family)
MAQSESQFGGLVNPKTLPMILLGFGLLLLVLSFAVGWYSVDAKLRRWQHDPENAQGDFVGPFLGPLYKIDLEMNMLSIKTSAAPSQVETLMASRGGEPTYEDHAGRMGTIMLGVLLMQLAILVAFAATTGFYVLHRRRRNDYSGVTKRLFIVVCVLIVVSMVYFTARIGPAAEEDEKVILNLYPFNDQVAYAPLTPELGFWKQWKSDKTTVTIQGDNKQVWEFEVISRPSAGWWLTLAALGCAVGARVMAARNGDFGFEQGIEPPPPPPKLTAG